MSQLLDLTQPFPSKYVHGNPSGGGTYVGHEVVTQRLLQVCGPFSFEVAQVIRGHVAEIVADPKANSKRGKEGRPALPDSVVGIIGRLTVTIDGREVSIEEAGDCEDPHNWPHDGARMKDACSDAIKRCAMRLGLGIHLWAQDEFFIHDQLSQADPAPPSVSSATPGTGRRATPEAQAEDGNTAPSSAEVSRDSSAEPPPSEEEQLEAEQILALLKEWVGGNDSKHSRVRAEVAKASLEQNVAPPETIAAAPLSVLRAVAEVILAKENA